MSAREEAATAIVRSIRTGEVRAAALAARFLADEVVYTTMARIFTGRAAVLDRISGQWAMAPVMAAGHWHVAATAGGDVDASAEFPGLGAAPRSLRLRFRFDEADRVVAIDEEAVMPPPATPDPGFTPAVRRRIDRALAEGKPLVLAYIDDAGAPALSLRGSVQTYNDRQLCLWIRDAGSGLVRAIRAGRPLSFLYRDSASRTTLIGKGNGAIVEDPSLRQAIYDRIPEVEQRHDIDLKGAAALIAVDSLRGTAPEGPVLMQAPDDG